MKRILVYIISGIFSLIFSPISAQIHSAKMLPSGTLKTPNMSYSEASNIVKHLPDIIKNSDSLIKAGHYREAIALIKKTRTEFLFARYAINSMMLKNASMHVDMDKRIQSMQLMKLSYDSLMFSNRLMKEKNEKELLRKTSQIKLMQINKARQNYIITHQKTILDKARNDEMKHKMKILAGQRKQHLIVIGSILLVVLLAFVMVGFTVIQQRRRTKQLYERKEKAQQARITAQKSRQIAIEARKKADEASTMKMVFIQNMSHEIRTPLNAIVGFSQIFADSSMDLDEASKAEFSKLIASSSDLMTTLINDILDLSNLTSGQYKMKYSQTTVQTIGNAAYTTVKYRTPPGVTMSFDLPEDKTDLTLWTDSRRVEQVLINYFTNACKYTTEGSIRLTYNINYDEHHQPITVCYSVTDTGSGIPPEKAESVFHRFEKLDDFKQGNGLGLNICRTIAERLNARCWLDTNYHSGARFFFEMPVHLEEPKLL